MGILDLVKNSGNVQIVCTAADLKEVFNSWIDERESAKPQKEDKLLSADDAAGILGVKNVTMWRWCKAGILKPVKVGKKVHYWKSDIDNLLKKEG